jgi:hypothetical protein
MTTVRQIEERTARARSLMARSRAEGFAVGAFTPWSAKPAAVGTVCGRRARFVSG